MNLKKMILYALAVVGLMACNGGDDIANVNSNQGVLVLDLNANQDVELVTRASISTVTGYTAPTKDKFTFTVKDEDNELVWSGKVTDLTDGKLPLDAGSYNVTAEYSEGGYVGSPVFKGSVSNVSINGGVDTPVVVPVSLANTIVKLEFDDMFKGYYTWSDFTLSSSGVTETITYAANETKGVFVAAADLTVQGTLTSQAQDANFASKSVDFNKTFTGIKAGKCYTLRFTASNVGNGGKITITFGNEVEEEIDVDIELNPEE